MPAYDPKRRRRSKPPEGSSVQAEADERSAVAGSVERVTFHNPDSGFCVLRVKVRGQRGISTVIGTTPSISPGEWIQASGKWQNTPEHGVQFKADLLQVTPPSSLEGMERYLGSGMIRGIGPTMAKRLIKAFGTDVFDVIDEHPERLKTVDGIGPVRVRRILEGWREQKQIREIMVFLTSHGLGSSRALRIYKTYGADAVPLISENPYRLARDIRGIGFRSADQVAKKIGIEHDAMVRARAGLAYTLLQAQGAGHCGLPVERLLDEGEELLEIRRARLEEALQEELDDGALVRDTVDGETAVFLPHLHRAEESIAARLRTLAVGAPSWGNLDADGALQWVETKIGFELAASQKQAVREALSSKALVITGGPGVGKTTLVDAILRIVGAKNVEVALCAPTGRAAKRLSESTGLEAKTIHRLLEVDPHRGGFQRGPENPLECDLLVVDETSMVDVPLMASLLEALPDEGAVLLVGDVDQLPSVGPGQVLADVIDSGLVPVARLTEIFRQAAASRIVTSAHRIREGTLPELEAGESPSDFYFVPAEDPEQAMARLVEMVGRRIPRRFGLDPIDDVQVLCPMNRGGMGTRSVNLELQARLNPPGRERAEVERFGWTFRVGDKVMQTENDYDKDVFNGDVGRVTRIHREEQEVHVRFAGGAHDVAYRFGELDQLTLAYAISIHKSQGSEYPAVVIPLLMHAFVMLQRNLVYTAVTRGRKLVVLLGQEKAVSLAVRGRPQERRVSRLRELLQAGEAA